MAFAELNTVFMADDCTATLLLQFENNDTSVKHSKTNLTVLVIF